MPGLTTSRRRSREPDDSEDEVASDSAASSSSGRQSGGGSKRARLDHDAFSEESESPVLPDSYRNGDNEYTIDPHQPGSIVRVKLTNFVTYTAAEFFPGPSLNMIIGPNGTGKSTLVCAICLGLGWSANNLGRAKDASEYVKYGAREAEIEIELAGGRPTKNRNPIIRRTIKKEGNKSTFTINGRSTSAKGVMELAKSFSIQIDNLCQFLPQDRVVEFAQLSPIEKLKETQRAVASDEVVKMHEQLIECRQAQKAGQLKQKHDQDHLNNLLIRHNAQRADVERQQERQTLIIREKALRSMKPFIEYRGAKAEAEEAKRIKKEAKANLIRLQREVEPSLRAVNAKQEYRDQIKEVVNARKRVVQAKERLADDYPRKLEIKEQKVIALNDEIEGEKNGDKENKRLILQHERNITRIKAQLEEEPAPFDAAEYNKKIREKERLQRELQDQANDITTEQKNLQRQAEESKRKKAEAQADLENLRSQSGQLVNTLKRVSQETARAWEWVQQNGHLFEEPIYGPPVVTCRIKDPKYANAVESMVMRAEYTAFTCTNKRDFNNLQRELLGRMKLHDINIRWVTRKLDQYRPPVPNHALQEYGLEGWLIDFVEGPEPVLAMLCDNSNLHRTAVSLQPDSDEQYNKLVNSPIQTWVAGPKSFRILRRKEYGSNAMSTIVRPIREAQVWTDQPIDVGAERDIRSRIGELDMKMEELSRQYKETKERKQRLGEESKTLVAEKNALEKEKSDKQKIQSAFAGLPAELAHAEEQKETVETTRASMRQRIATKQAEINALQLEKGQLVLDYANAVEILRLAFVALMEAEILHIEASSEYDAVAAESAHINQMLEETRKAEADIIQNYSRLFNRAKALAKKCEEVHHTRTDEEAAVQNEFADIQTFDELNSEIESVKTRLELMTDGNPHAIAQFEERAEQIAKLEERLNSLNNELEKVQDQVTRIRAEWEPQVDALVDQISDGFSRNFEKIGCAGQVQIDKHEDFDQWSIEILVRFRENEELAILDSHRQSGGERAVSTIFYLMALQDMARSPFRVVDEINQGMDPRNERMVHERMVDIACQERTSQYFLITPKLLNNLKFHPKMKVHCIASGEYMPSKYEELDFPSLLDVALRVKGQA